LAVDGKTMCNARDNKQAQTHILSAVGHDSAVCYTQKSRHSARSRSCGYKSLETAVGLTRQTPNQANAQQVLAANRGHWTIDWNFNEDRSRIRKGFGSENVTRLRRFIAGVLSMMSAGKGRIAETMAKLNHNTRLVFLLPSHDKKHCLLCHNLIFIFLGGGVLTLPH